MGLPSLIAERMTRPRVSKKKVPRWPDYERVEMKGVITFGTTIFMRKDKRAIRILFPAGQSMEFAPEDEIAAQKQT